VTVTDIKLSPASVTLNRTTLAPGETATGTGTYTVTLADRNAGSVTNQATTKGTSPSGVEVADESGTTNTNDNPTVVGIPQTPSINLVKMGVLSSNGNTITYSFAVTNTGNVTLNNITVEDSKLNPSSVVLSSTTLTPGQTATGSGIYTITLEDRDAGEVENQATATGTSPAGAEVTDESGTNSGNDDPTVVVIPQTPAIALLKTGTLSGDTITYSFTVTNTGNVTLSPVTLTDDLFADANVSLDSTSLKPGSSVSATKLYTLTQADKDKGSVLNQALATGTSPAGVDVTDLSGTTFGGNDSTVVVISQTSSIALIKTGALTVSSDAIVYSFSVINTGNVSIDSIVVTDEKLVPTSIQLDKTMLLPGDTAVGSGIYIITQADRDLGVVKNTALTSGKTSGGIIVTDTSGTSANNNDTSVVVIPQTASIALVKTGVISADQLSIVYTFTITNTGNITLDSLTLLDTKIGLNPIDIASSVLAPGESTTGTASYIITPTDRNNRNVSNTATVSGRSGFGSTVFDVSGTDLENDNPTLTPIAPCDPGVKCLESKATRKK
jgi:uncharacterized repeat protein (TIGR01451 family)